MTPKDLQSLCLKYGLVMSRRYTSFECGYVYPVYSIPSISLSWDNSLGEFTAQELSSSDPGDVEARVVEWSLKASFGGGV
jgi:hypothetical protein